MALVRDDFSDAEREALYRIIGSRRDVRAFRRDPVPDDVLGRILHAAHQAPSVGFMQPWSFIVIRDPVTRARVKDVFLWENERASANYAGDRADLYRSLKLEGLEDAPINLCVTCDRTRGGPHVLGRNTIIDTDLYSTCCAVQNLWLAARAEGVGVGWVSILDNDALRGVLDIPAHVVPVAYLCAGYPREFFETPELERRGWAHRLPLEDVVYRERWQGPLALRPRHGA
jgi:5,6-dimethylbenzimidazole synthase